MKGDRGREFIKAKPHLLTSRGKQLTSDQPWKWNIRGLAPLLRYYATAQQNGYLTNRLEWKTKTMILPKGCEHRTNPCRAKALVFYVSRFLVNEIIIPALGQSGVKKECTYVHTYKTVLTFGKCMENREDAKQPLLLRSVTGGCGSTGIVSSLLGCHKGVPNRGLSLIRMGAYAQLP